MDDFQDVAFLIQLLNRVKVDFLLSTVAAHALVKTEEGLRNVLNSQHLKVAATTQLHWLHVFFLLCVIYRVIGSTSLLIIFHLESSLRITILVQPLNQEYIHLIKGEKVHDELGEPRQGLVEAANVAKPIQRPIDSPVYIVYA